MAKCHSSKSVRLDTLVCPKSSLYDSANIQKINEDDFRVNVLFIFRFGLPISSALIFLLYLFWGMETAFLATLIAAILFYAATQYFFNLVAKTMSEKSQSLSFIENDYSKLRDKLKEKTEALRYLDERLESRGLKCKKLEMLIKSLNFEKSQIEADLQEKSRAFDKLYESFIITKNDLNNEVYQSIREDSSNDRSIELMELDGMRKSVRDMKKMIGRADGENEFTFRRIEKELDNVLVKMIYVETACLCIRSGRKAIHLGGHDISMEQAEELARDMVIERSHAHGMVPRLEHHYDLEIAATTRLFSDRRFFPRLLKLIYPFAEIQDFQVAVKIDYKIYNKNAFIVSMEFDFLNTDSPLFDKRFYDAYSSYRMTFQPDYMDNIGLHPLMVSLFRYCAYYSVKLKPIDEPTSTLRLYRKINVCLDDAHARRFQELREEYIAAGVFYVVDEKDMSHYNIKRIQSCAQDKEHTFSVIDKSQISYHLISSTSYVIFDFSITSMERMAIYESFTENTDFDRVTFISLGGGFGFDSSRIIQVENVDELDDILI